jgi:MoxR-like ATPase
MFCSRFATASCLRASASCYTPRVDSPTAKADSPAQALSRVRGAVAQAIRGKDEIIELALVALVARGHVLIEDIPGVGKSTLARALANAVGGTFSRIQFTSDLLPADLLGVNVWRASVERFEFRPGPIFANVVLADEVNRAPPRTQSALLEAMGERQVTVDGVSRTLDDPFVVLATQNPEEYHGTYPLPESQRDRFLVRTSMGYASPEVETRLLVSGGAESVNEVQPAIDAATLAQLQASADRVGVHEDLGRYAQQIVQATREDSNLRLGVSTRGALAWVAAARARALLSGRDRVAIDDLQDLAVPALAHRVIASTHSGVDQNALVSDEIIRDVVARVPVPV